MFKTAKFYDFIYRDKDYAKEAEFIIKFLRKGRTLDIGGGTGNLAQFLKPPRFNPIVVDIDDQMLEGAKKKNLRTLHANIQFKTLVKVNNIILWFHVFNFFEYQGAALANISATLKDGGRLILDFWNSAIKKDGWSIKIDWRLTRITRKKWSGDSVTIDFWYPFLLIHEQHILKCPQTGKILTALNAAGFKILYQDVAPERSEHLIVAEKDEKLHDSRTTKNNS